MLQETNPLGDQGGHDRRQQDVGPPTGVTERRQRRAGVGLKMSCPFCAESESAVVDTRGAVTEDSVRRRRECAGCRRRFPTQERIDWPALFREFPGNDEQLLRGLAALLRDYPGDEGLRDAIARHLADAAARGDAQRRSCDRN